MKIGIYNETDVLKSAALWGYLGVEGVLAQLYPPSISLFLDNMNVLKAREEIKTYIAVLKKHKVKTWLVRDILAEALPSHNIQKEMVLRVLFQKAQDIIDEYKTGFQNDTKELIEHLVEEDIKRYGRPAALSLNWRLSLYPSLPLGNLLYARDQMNVLLGKRISSSMEKPIRRPEVDLYEIAYKDILGGKEPVITIPKNERFEGGDAYIHGKTIYIGIGPRTSKGAAVTIYKALLEEILEKGYSFVLVEDKNVLQRNSKEQMLFMHLDTFSNPIGEKQIAVCIEEAKRRTVSVISMEKGIPTISELNTSFWDYLLEHNEEVIAIPKEEQQTFGCNFLAIDSTTILVPRLINKTTIDELQKVGKTVEYVGLDECTKGYGAAHCMTGQLVRKTT